MSRPGGLDMIQSRYFQNTESNIISIRLVTGKMKNTIHILFKATSFLMGWSSVEILI